MPGHEDSKRVEKRDKGMVDRIRDALFVSGALITLAFWISPDFRRYLEINYINRQATFYLGKVVPSGNEKKLSKTVVWQRCNNSLPKDKSPSYRYEVNFLHSSWRNWNKFKTSIVDNLEGELLIGREGILTIPGRGKVSKGRPYQDGEVVAIMRPGGCYHVLEVQPNRAELRFCDKKDDVRESITYSVRLVKITCD